MRYCPNCKAEYRDGFDKCIDCEIDLVDELPADAETQMQRQRATIGKVSPEPELGEEIPIITVNDEVKFVYITSLLEQENIPFRVMQQGTGHYLSIYFGSSYMGKTIYVDKKNYEKALEIAASFNRGQILNDDE